MNSKKFRRIFFKCLREIKQIEKDDKMFFIDKAKKASRIIKSKKTVNIIEVIEGRNAIIFYKQFTIYGKTFKIVCSHAEDFKMVENWYNIDGSKHGFYYEKIGENRIIYWKNERLL